MKNKRKIIIIVVCVIAAAAIAVGAGVGYYYSRPERTAEKVLPCILWTTQKFKGTEKPLTTGLLTHISATCATVLLPINAPKA